MKKSNEKMIICENCGMAVPASRTKKCSKCGAVLCDVCMAWHHCTDNQHDIEKEEKLDRKVIVIVCVSILVTVLISMGAGFLLYSIIVESQHPQIILNTSVSGVVNSSHTFKIGADNITINATADAELYYGAMDSAVQVRIWTMKVDNFSTGNMTHIFGNLWGAPIYPDLINDGLQDEFYQNLLEQFRTVKSNYNLTNDEYVEMLASYVQSLSYDDEALLRGKVKYPVVTAIDKIGDCDETSILLAGLLEREGYDTGLLELCLFFEDGSQNGHMMVCIRTNDENNLGDGTNYAYIETTNNSLIYYGNISSFMNSNVTEIIHKFIPIGNGTKTYNSAAECMVIHNYGQKRFEELNLSSDDVYIISEDRGIKRDELPPERKPINAFDRGSIYDLISERLHAQNASNGAIQVC